MFVSFAVPSFGSYEYCQYQRRREKAGVQRAVEVMDQKRVEKAKRLEDEKQKRRLGKEQKERQAEEDTTRSQRKWWKPW